MKITIIKNIVQNRREVNMNKYNIKVYFPNGKYHIRTITAKSKKEAIELSKPTKIEAFKIGGVKK